MSHNAHAVITGVTHLLRYVRENSAAQQISALGSLFICAAMPLVFGSLGNDNGLSDSTRQEI